LNCQPRISIDTNHLHRSRAVSSETVTELFDQAKDRRWNHLQVRIHLEPRDDNGVCRY